MGSAGMGVRTVRPVGRGVRTGPSGGDLRANKDCQEGPPNKQGPSGGGLRTNKVRQAGASEQIGSVGRSIGTSKAVGRGARTIARFRIGAKSDSHTEVGVAAQRKYVEFVSHRCDMDESMLLRARTETARSNYNPPADPRISTADKIR